MLINKDDLLEIVNSVWSMTVEVDLILCDTANAKPDVDSNFICAWIEMNGDNHGGLLLNCQESLVKHAASVMFEVEPELLGEDAMDDTFAELANMISGSLKALLPPTIALDQPVVLQESDIPEECIANWPKIYMTFQFNDNMFYVSFFEW